MTYIYVIFGDEYKLMPVPVPRVPIVGETLRGPDDFGTWRVVSVEFQHDSGFHFPPTNVVVVTERV